MCLRRDISHEVRATSEVSTRVQIVENLKKIKVSEESANHFVDIVERMPGNEALKTGLKYLTHEKNPGSKREGYYQVSNQVAEFFCTLSNAGFFAVGFAYGDYAALTAGLLSALSHTIPFQSLQILDYIGILVVFAKAASEYKTIAAKPSALAWAGGAISFNLIDTLAATVANKCYAEDSLIKTAFLPLTHATWHLSAAVALYEFNKANAEVTKKEFNKTSLSIDIVFIALLACLYGIPLIYCTVNKIFNGCKNTFFANDSGKNNRDLEAEAGVNPILDSDKQSYVVLK